MIGRRRADPSVLLGVAPFDRYRRRALAPLAAHADRLRVTSGTVFAREGHLARELVIVLSGAVLATRGGQPVGAFGPGTAIGGAELLAGGVHQATLVAGEGLEVLVLAGPAYRYAAQTLPGLAGDVAGAAPGPPGALRGAAA
ncbi:MAG: cyclic nucleotide-binding domain-containing protein [Acidimicrobiales bacterium]